MPISFPATATRSVSDAQSDINQLLDSLRKQSHISLNLGCGDHPIAGVLNYDLHSPHADVRADIVDLEYADGSVAFIETHHMIEHLSIHEVRPALAEWSRVLEPGGHLAITCPDMEQVIELWKDSSKTLDSYEMKMLFGSQEHPGMYHKCGFCATSLSSLLNTSGFITKFMYSPYPDRTTPSLLVIAERQRGE